MKSLLRFLVATAAASVALMAGDLTITFNSTSAVMGKKASGVQTHYYNVNFHKTVDEGTRTDTLVDFGKGVFYTIKHKEKKVEMMTFDDLVAIGEAAAKQMENVPAFMRGMMGGDSESEIKVEQTGTDTVAGRACKKYRMSVGKIVQDLSMDPSLKPPVNPAAYTKFMKLQGNRMGTLAGSMKKLYSEMAKLQGLALKTHLTGMMGMDASTEATKVDMGAIPAATFVLPAGYPVEDAGKKALKDLQSR